MKRIVIISIASVFFILLLFIGLNVEREKQKNSTSSLEKNMQQEKTEKLKNILYDLFTNIPHPLETTVIEDILVNPFIFLKDIYLVLVNTPKDLLILVDKSNSIGNFIPNNLVYLDEYKNIFTLSKSGLQLQSVVITHLSKMIHDAKNKSINIPISSTYRNYAYQKKVFERAVRTLGKEVAQRESAKEGMSQHQLGLTIDFGSIDDSFTNTPASHWLAKNSWKYGFSLSYPQGKESITGYRFESWHYRYIGVLAARFEKKYLENSQQQMLELFLNRDIFLHLYKIYIQSQKE